MRIGFYAAGLITSLFLLNTAACSHKTPPPHMPVGEGGVVAAAAIGVDGPTTAAVIHRVEVVGDATPNLIRVDKDQEVIVRVRVRGLPMMTKKRAPLNLGLVVDTSGSMEGQPIEQARGACATLIDLLSNDDTVSIVTFGSRAKVIVPSIRISKETRETAKKAITGIKAEGTTDMAGGLAQGLQQVRAHLAPDGIHRIVLVGDGVPNEAPPVLALADSAKAEHVPVTVLGLGNDFDETLMTSLAQRSSGTFHFVDDASRVASVFKEQITRMERVVARNMRLEITPGPGVTITEVVGIPSSASGRGQIAALGDFAEGQSRDVFVRVTTKGRHDGKTMELIDAQVSFTAPEGGPEVSTSSFMKIAASSDAVRVKDANVAEIEHAFTTVRVADGIVKAIAFARDGDLPNARKVLDTSVRLAKEGEKKFGDKALGEKVVEMNKLRKTLPSLAPAPEPMSEALSSAGAPAPAKAKPAVAPAPPASPKEAMELRAAHGDALKTLQGD